MVSLVARSDDIARRWHSLSTRSAIDNVHPADGISANSTELAAKPCQLNRSMQHWLAVYSTALLAAHIPSRLNRSLWVASLLTKSLPDYSTRFLLTGGNKCAPHQFWWCRQSNSDGTRYVSVQGSVSLCIEVKSDDRASICGIGCDHCSASPKP